MFGEIPMYGNYIATVNKKGRFNLPAKFNGEVGEEILLVREDNNLALYPISYFNEKLNSLENLLNDTSNIESRNDIKK